MPVAHIVPLLKASDTAWINFCDFCDFCVTKKVIVIVDVIVAP